MPRPAGDGRGWCPMPRPASPWERACSGVLAVGWYDADFRPRPHAQAGEGNTPGGQDLPCPAASVWEALAETDQRGPTRSSWVSRAWSTWV